MLELTPDTVANAAKRARSHHGKVSRISDTEIAVTCQNPDHPGGHIARFERRADGRLWAECVVRATGELCPTHIGRNRCWHMLAGVTLFIAIEEMRAAEDRDGAVERAVIFDAPLPAAEGQGAPPVGGTDAGRALSWRERNERFERLFNRATGFGGHLRLA